MKLLIIGENYLSQHYIMASLTELGHFVDCFRDLSDGNTLLNTVNYCAVIAINPKEHSIKYILKCKRISNTALVVLSENSTVKERILFYNTGIDDYINYPVDILELQARLQASIRRRNNVSDTTLSHQDITYNLLSRDVYKSGKMIYLTSTERCLLEVFFLNKGRILTKRFIEDKLFSWDKDINSNVIEVHISSLRKKLGRECITTFSGQGYRLG